MSIFDRLGYDAANTSSIVTPLSANVISTMNGLPPLLNTWQTADAANKGIKKMLLATCCANRYTELSWKILQPKDALGTPLTFKEYEEIAKKSKSCIFDESCKLFL